MVSDIGLGVGCTLVEEPEKVLGCLMGDLGL